MTLFSDRLFQAILSIKVLSSLPVTFLVSFHGIGEDDGEVEGERGLGIGGPLLASG